MQLHPFGPTATEYDAILVVVDRYTKIARCNQLKLRNIVGQLSERWRFNPVQDHERRQVLNSVIEAINKSLSSDFRQEARENFVPKSQSRMSCSCSLLPKLLPVYENKFL
jgi:hypothetical protein